MHSKGVFWCLYTGQIKYHSDDSRLPPVDFTPTYTIGEIKKLLNIESRSTIYNIYKRHHLELIRMDGQTRVVKESFDNWFRSQSIYPRKRKEVR